MAMGCQILMMDGDLRLVQTMGTFLGQSGFSLIPVATGREGLDRLAEACVHHDLVLLDMMLPDMDGIEICRAIRLLEGHRSKTPILMLTGKSEAADRIMALESGADDCMTKPFNPYELLARVRAILRRRGPAPERPSQIMRFGALEIDQVMRTARVGERLCKLSQSQFDVLVALALQAGSVLTRGQLMNSTDQRPSLLSVRAIDVQIWRLRQAIESDAKKPKRIITVSGAGYMFVRQQD